jgi:2-polyprenyl-3-methyl-5-hydroxy-6-metoxy-1,4-benzoquinol methylase
MNLTLQSIIERIQLQDPLHAKKLKRNLKNLNSDYESKTLENGVDNYLKMIADFMYEQLRFSETGKYSSTSFEEVNNRVYNNPEVMDYFMNGLLLSQVLWKHHYSIFSFFSNNFPNYKNNIHNYLEIGGGHGLFISEAINVLGGNTHFTLVDISPTSIEVSKKFIGSNLVEYVLSDIFKYETNTKYNFITMGEVIEHVEDPVALLNKLKELLAPNGVIFMTTPTNAPSIDHIYLFRNALEVIDVIHEAGLEVIEDIKVYAEDLPEEMAIKLKVTMMYGCFLKLK